MEILNYALTALITVLGLACGAVIGHFASEELKPGRKYFILLQKALFASVIAVVMYANRANVHYIWAGMVLIFVYLYFFERISNVLAYAALSAVFFIASAGEMFLPAAFLIFLYGFPAGSMLGKNKKKMIILIIEFAVIVFFLYFLNQKL